LLLAWLTLLPVCWVFPHMLHALDIYNLRKF
jgi:hypothetical protein